MSILVRKWGCQWASSGVSMGCQWGDRKHVSHDDQARRLGIELGEYPTRCEISTPNSKFPPRPRSSRECASRAEVGKRTSLGEALPNRAGTQVRQTHPRFSRPTFFPASGRSPPSALLVPAPWDRTNALPLSGLTISSVQSGKKIGKCRKCGKYRFSWLIKSDHPRDCITTHHITSTSLQTPDVTAPRQRWIDPFSWGVFFPQVHPHTH